VDQHPRYLADLTGDGRADIVGFGYAGVWVSLNEGDGTFTEPVLAVTDFGYGAGGWRVDQHPRYLADLTGDNRADIVGFGYAGAWVSVNEGDGTFVTPFVRRDVWGLQANAPWDPMTEAYARAVKVMQGRPATDPTSWRFQAAMHGSYNAAPAGALWNQCQHQSWYFLPWHRMYVYYFERIVRAAVRSVGGPADFAIPYWNYDRGFPQNTLPRPFREATLPNGDPNPLFLPPPRRSSAIQSGGQLPSLVTSSSAADAMIDFAGPPGPGFGGGRQPPTQFGGSTGGLEQTPHNVIHVQIGGNPSGNCQGGLMADPFCAALDPIFWLHHANIDRLWSSWLALGGGRADPPDASWNNQSFTFYDETGAAVQLTCAQVVATAAQLDYTYDDQSTVTSSAVSNMDAPTPGPSGSRRPPELVAATDRPVDLVGAALSVTLAVPASVRALVASEDTATGRRVYLNVEDIEAERNPGVVYGVFLNMPSGTDDAHRFRHHAGNFTLFGIESMNDPDTPHGGVPGLRHTFDITQLVARLAEAGLWNPDAITVTFAPITPLPPPETADLAETFVADAVQPSPTPVRVGRVSLFVG
jgi:hypothetical protein